MARRNFFLAAGSLLLAAVALVSAARHDRPRSFDDYRENTQALLEAASVAPRIWAHRINSPGALLEAKELFAGVEVDIVFDRDARSFAVRHPPQPDTGFALEQFLARSADRPDLRLWLDWKNPTPGNLQEALTELARLDGKYRIRDRALVETPSDATFPEIAAVSRHGFLHGYYLPTKRALDALQSGPHAIARLGAEVRAILEGRNYGAVTYDARLQPFVDRQLDPFLRQRKLRRFSWDPTINSGDPDTLPERLSQITTTRGLDALLINFPSRFKV